MCCRPSGSSDVYYVDSSAEEMSAAVSETTVESTHPGMDYEVLALLRLAVTYYIVSPFICFTFQCSFW